MDEFDFNSDPNLYKLTAALYSTVCYWLGFTSICSIQDRFLYCFLYFEFFKAGFDAVHQRKGRCQIFPGTKFSGLFTREFTAGFNLFCRVTFQVSLSE